MSYRRKEDVEKKHEGSLLYPTKLGTPVFGGSNDLRRLEGFLASPVVLSPHIHSLGGGVTARLWGVTIKNTYPIMLGGVDKKKMIKN
jgi:hypothetical protein